MTRLLATPPHPPDALLALTHPTGHLESRDAGYAGAAARSRL
jgi:hypothetical protein